jgi:Pilus formation protein N terminal region
VLRVSSVLGTLAATIADPSIADIAVDQVARTISVTGKTLGTTTITLHDDRGVTRDVGVRVAYNAGSVADSALVRITGNPATAFFVKEQAALAAARQSRAREKATIITTSDGLDVPSPLTIDNVTNVAVPVIIQGEGYFTVQGTTRVRVENVALPRISPDSLMVSDFPETLKDDGVLFTSELSRDTAARFLYYHYNPPGQPDRRIVLKVRNDSAQPATVQFITGAAGPSTNEMEVGHLSTRRFLVRVAQNEGTVSVIQPNSTVELVDQPLPARSIVSNLMQLRELQGAPLHLTLVARTATATGDDPPDSKLLSGDQPHARGVYEIPEFFFERTYDTSQPDLVVPIGQIPLPNLRQGQALAGDYGVLQQITIRMVNNDRRPARVALYANPRGGRATGTFLIDRVLIQAHALAPFTNYKLREYTVPANGYASTTIVTMPEGGSSYPLNLIMGPDDGSVSPGAPGSPVY